MGIQLSKTNRVLYAGSVDSAEAGSSLCTSCTNFGGEGNGQGRYVGPVRWETWDISDNYRYLYFHSPDLAALQSSAKNGCTMCGLISKGLGAVPAEFENAGGQLESRRPVSARLVDKILADETEARACIEFIYSTFYHGSGTACPGSADLERGLSGRVILIVESLPSRTTGRPRLPEIMEPDTTRLFILPSILRLVFHNMHFWSSPGLSLISFMLGDSNLSVV